MIWLTSQRCRRISCFAHTNESSCSIVLDAKYHREALQTHRGKRTVRSTHLYQISSYLNNLQANEGRAVEGLLLYPTVDTSFDFNYSLNGNRIALRTIDLARPWQ